jgi:hypothetical protein
VRAKGRFEQMAATPQGVEKLKLLIRSFLIAHKIYNVVIDIPEPRFVQFAAQLDTRFAAAILPASSKQEIARATRRVVIDCLDELLEIQIPAKADVLRRARLTLQQFDAARFPRVDYDASPEPRLVIREPEGGSFVVILPREVARVSRHGVSFCARFCQISTKSCKQASFCSFRQGTAKCSS